MDDFQSQPPVPGPKLRSYTAVFHKIKHALAFEKSIKGDGFDISRKGKTVKFKSSEDKETLAALVADTAGRGVKQWLGLDIPTLNGTACK